MGVEEGRNESAESKKPVDLEEAGEFYVWNEFSAKSMGNFG